MLVLSRLLKLVGILVMLAMAFKIGSLDTSTMVFIGAALIVAGSMLPKVFAPSDSDGGSGGQAEDMSGEEEE
jgi:hypothetical protein